MKEDKVCEGEGSKFIFQIIHGKRRSVQTLFLLKFVQGRKIVIGAQKLEIRSACLICVLKERPCSTSKQLLLWLHWAREVVPLLCFSFELRQDICFFTTILLHVVLDLSVIEAVRDSLVPDQKGSSGVFLASVLGVGL